MKFRDDQLDAFAAASMDRARRERLLAMNGQGYQVTENPGRNFLVRDAEGQSTKVESRGLRARVISPEGRATETEQYSNGRIRGIVDSAGHEVRFERDADGFLKSIDRGPEGGVYRFQLSPDWKPLRIDYPDGTASQAEYSPTGEPVRIVQRDGTEIRYEYGPDGKLTALFDPLGHRTRVSDHEPGASRTIDFPNGDRHAYVDDIAASLQRFEVNGSAHAVYRHDPETGSIEALYRDRSRERFKFAGGRLVEAKNEHTTVKFEYDDAGRLLLEDSGGQIVQYLRNETGALVGIVTPQGEKIAYIRDRDQRLTGITDWTGSQYKFVLSPSGPPTEIRYPNGLSVATSINAMGLPSTWAVHRSGSPRDELDSAAWRHDNCDRVIAATRGGGSRDYRYNKGSRLTGVQCAGTKLEERFELDSRGNRVQSAGAACSYDPMNRLLRNGSREFSYDGLGNRTEDRDGAKRSTYTYNGRGQLVSIQNSQGLVAEYAYDPLGRRIRKRVGKVTTHFQWAGTRLLSEITDDGVRVIRRDYLFCPEYLTPLAFREGPSVYYMHCGRLHEPLCVTDKTGRIVWKAEYLAFGEALISVEQVRQPWRLPGQYYDEETRLHYAVARYYDPALGRFLSMDPQLIPGASLNYYTYCDGDPVNRVDPTGEISLTLGTVLVAIGIGIVVGAAIGAGVELYKQRNQEKTDWSQVGYAALIGGCLGGIGGAVGVVAEAAALGALGVLGAGAAAGGLGAAAEYCVQAAGEGKWSWSDFGTSVAVGAGIGAITAGIGGIVAARAARKAAQAAREAAERAAREAAERAAREAADRAAREAAERAAREAAERAAREAAAIAEREALERAAKDAAAEATKDAGKNELTAAGRSLTKHGKGQRAGSKGFPDIKGSPKDINKQAAEVLDGIVSDPNKVIKVRPGKGGEEILQVSRPDGTGAIYKKVNGQWVFSHFAENLY
jgi:RHS repeat-associated protein